jgi:hypothetical protein
MTLFLVRYLLLLCFCLVVPPPSPSSPSPPSPSPSPSPSPIAHHTCCSYSYNNSSNGPWYARSWTWAIDAVRWRSRITVLCIGPTTFIPFVVFISDASTSHGDAATPTAAPSCTDADADADAYRSPHNARLAAATTTNGPALACDTTASTNASFSCQWNARYALAHAATAASSFFHDALDEPNDATAATTTTTTATATTAAAATATAAAIRAVGNVEQGYAAE